MLTCPHCGNNKPQHFTYLENLPAVRHVRSVSKNVIIVDGLVHDHSYESPTEIRLHCNDCVKEFPVPEGMTIEFI